MTGKRVPLVGERVYGPYLNKDGRMKVIIYTRHDHPYRSLNLSRHLMEQRLGRMLTRTEIVHHINGDLTDDTIDNLEVLSTKEHRATTSQQSKWVNLVCPVCDKEFSRTTRRLRYGEKMGHRPCCSRECAKRVRWMSE